MNRILAAIFLTTLGAAGPAIATEMPEAQLKAEIVAADARLFAGVNARDIAPLKAGFSPRLEFYHDRGGLTGYAENIALFERNFRAPNRIRREPMPETVQVFPAGPKHAMHVGRHRFCNRAPGEAPEECGVYGFAMVWEREGGQWKLLRVLSYGH